MSDLEKNMGLYKAILQNIGKKSEELKPESEKYLQSLEKDLKRSLSLLYEGTTKIS